MGWPGPQFIDSRSGKYLVGRENRPQGKPGVNCRQPSSPFGSPFEIHSLKSCFSSLPSSFLVIRVLLTSSPSAITSTFPNTLPISSHLWRWKTASGNVKWHSDSRRVWWFLIKWNICLPYDSRERSWAFVSEKGKLKLTQNRYKNVHSSFICNSPKLEVVQTSFAGRRVEHTAVRWTHCGTPNTLRYALERDGAPLGHRQEFGHPHCSNTPHGN